MLAILRSMGVDTASTETIDQAISARLAQQTTLLPASLVLLAGSPDFVVTVPNTLKSQELHATIYFEDGVTMPLTYSFFGLEPFEKSSEFSRYRFLLPKNLPIWVGTWPVITTMGIESM